MRAATSGELSRRLVKVMVSLSAEKPFDDITVTDVISRAHVGRGTFYRHFRDKNDVLDHFFADEAEEVRRRVPMRMKTPDDYFSMLFAVFNEFRIHKDVMKMLFSARQETTYFDQLLAGTAERWTDAPDSFRPAFVAGAFYGVTKVWLSHDCAESVKSVCDSFIAALRGKDLPF